MLVVVQLDRVVPIVDTRIGCKHVVARGLGWELFVRLLADSSWRHKRLALTIIKITRVKAFILSCQMIRDEVDDDFHAFCMDAVDQMFKVGHRAQIGVYSMVVVDRIRRAGTAFGDVGVRANAF